VENRDWQALYSVRGKQQARFSQSGGASLQLLTHHKTRPPLGIGQISSQALFAHRNRNRRNGMTNYLCARKKFSYQIVKLIVGIDTITVVATGMSNLKVTP